MKVDKKYLDLMEAILEEPNGEFQAAQAIQTNSDLYNSIGLLKGEYQDFIRVGNAFVVGYSSQRGEGLILTARHCVIDTEQGGLKPVSAFWFYIQNDIYEAHPLLTDDQLQIQRTPSEKDPISDCYALLNQDYAFLTITELPNTLYTVPLQPLKLVTEFNEINLRDQMFIAGISYRPQNIAGFQRSIAPFTEKSCDEVQTELESRVMLACDGSSIVYFEGELLSKGSLLAFSGSSIKGMSGSPLISNIGGEYKVVGVLHGGAPNDLQRLCLEYLRWNFEQDLIGKLREIRGKVDRGEISIDSSESERIKFFLDNHNQYPSFNKGCIRKIYMDGIHIIRQVEGDILKHNSFYPLYNDDFKREWTQRSQGFI